MVAAEFFHFRYEYSTIRTISLTVKGTLPCMLECCGFMIEKNIQAIVQFAGALAVHPY